MQRACAMFAARSAQFRLKYPEDFVKAEYPQILKSLLAYYLNSERCSFDMASKHQRCFDCPQSLLGQVFGKTCRRRAPFASC